MAVKTKQTKRTSTGIEGLDRVLEGGLAEGMVYLLRGGPGTGKTTLGFQFLMEGVRSGEGAMYASFLQSPKELEIVRESHGWSFDGIEMLELPEDVRNASYEDQTFFSPADVELTEVVDALEKAVEKGRPNRLVLDSVTELGILVDNPGRLQRQLLRLKRRLQDFECTAILTASPARAFDLDALNTVVHGAVSLEMEHPKYGRSHRWLVADKMRGMRHMGGRHDFDIVTGGIEVYPRIEAGATEEKSGWNPISSGESELDELFGGGLEQGTACMVVGTTGAGKSTLASLYVEEAARRGEKSLVFCFDERRRTFLQRCSVMGMRMKEFAEEGIVDLRQVNVGEMSPGQFSETIRKAVEEDGAKMVVIDSLNGYFNSMPERRHLSLQLHELLGFLGAGGVLTFLIVALKGFVEINASDVEASYISDTVVLVRNFEASGTVRKCISVLKKRHGLHENTIREFEIGKDGVRVGPPLRQFRGILSGSPEFVGDGNNLLEKGGDDDGSGDA